MRKRGEPTVFESRHHRDEGSVKCVSVIVYACRVDVEYPDSFAGLDAKRACWNDIRPIYPHRSVRIRK